MAKFVTEKQVMSKTTTHNSHNTSHQRESATPHKLSNLPKSSTLCTFHKKICILALSQTHSRPNMFMNPTHAKFSKLVNGKINRNPNCNHNSTNICYRPTGTFKYDHTKPHEHDVTSSGDKKKIEGSSHKDKDSELMS